MIKKSTMKKSSKKPVKKAPVKKANKQSTSDDLSVQILATSKCKTVSGKSELTYNIGIDEKSRLSVRINGNTGGGFWSREWVTFDSITNALEAVPDDKAITSIHLFKVFVGKSQNSPGFLLASLLAERILEPLGKKRQYKLSESGVDAFLEKIDKLKSSKS